MNKLATILTFGACSLLLLGGLRAQAPSTLPSNAPAVSPATTPAVDANAPRNGGGRYRELLQSLSPEDREKLRLAREAAMADPTVQAARTQSDKRGGQEAIRAAMLKDDPSVAAVLAKLRAGAQLQRTGGQAAPGQPTAAATGGQPPAVQSPSVAAAKPAAPPARLEGEIEKRLAFLPENERAKVRNAYAAAVNDPQLTALRQQWMSAAPDAKAQAGKAFREGVRDAILRNDPSLAPILQKVREHQSQGGANAAVP